MDHPGPARRSPGPREPGNPLATPAMAVSLAIVLVALAAAIVLIPGLLPAASASPTPGAASGAPIATPAGSPTPSPFPSFIRPTPTPAPTFTSYVVRAGDSLNSIADRFATTARSLAWWNRGTYPSLDPESAGYDPNHIEPGWILVLIPSVRVDEGNPPTPSPGPPTPSPIPGPTPTPGGTPVADGPATVVSHGTRGTGQIAPTRLVMWDIDTIDWKAPADGGPTAEDIVTKVIAKAQGGSIVLMHLGGWKTLEALPDLLAGLESRGLTPVTLAEMQGTQGPGTVRGPPARRDRSRSRR